MNYLWAFVVGGAICVVGQLLIDYTKLSPARILTGYVVAGVILSAVGLYDPLVKLAGAGASVPLLGFGHLLAQGVAKAVDEIGLPGVFTGGIGENDGYVRSEVCKNMEFLGISIDAEKNKLRGLDINDITGEGSRVKVLVVCTNEELMIARDTKALVEAM